MPVYEYYCEPCNGIFEVLRSMREASYPQPCPLCDRDGQRIMPTSFMAFTFRDGYPRRIPDRGTYWHLGQEVSAPARGAVRPNEHPEINKRRPPPKKTKAQLEDAKERKVLQQREEKRMRDSRVPIIRRRDEP